MQSMKAFYLTMLKLNGYLNDKKTERVQLRKDLKKRISKATQILGKEEK